MRTRQPMRWHVPVHDREAYVPLFRFAAPDKIVEAALHSPVYHLLAANGFIMVDRTKRVQGYLEREDSDAYVGSAVGPLADEVTVKRKLVGNRGLAKELGALQWEMKTYVQERFDPFVVQQLYFPGDARCVA